MTEEWKQFSFVDQMTQFHRLSTDAPSNFCEVLGIQLLGHAMGYEPVNLIQPDAVRHNSYSLFVGESTITRKSTTQSFGQKIYPSSRCAPQESSPEQFIVELSEKSELFQFMPEFSGLLKGIAGKGYMARFAEVYNDMHSCPSLCVRKLRERKGKDSEFKIEKGYLSANSTVTPSVLKVYLKEEIMIGGLMARWLLVKGEPNPRPRSRLYPDALRIKEVLRSNLEQIIGMEKTGTKFVLSDKALARYREIEKEAYKKYDKVLPFVGRYMNYVVSFADILLVSDAIGISIAQGKGLHQYKQLIELIKLKSLIQLDNNNIVVEKYSGDTIADKVFINQYIRKNGINSSNYLIVSKEYIDRAWSIIEPCLEYASQLVDYVELDKPVAKLMDFMREKKYASHSKAMQYTHLNSIQMKVAVETLHQREQIEIEEKEVQRIGSGSITKKSYKWIGG